MEKYTYLLLDIGSLLIPLACSFEKRLAFYRQWKALFPALAITATFFIIWDHYLTVWGVWGFNPKYVIGVWFWDLPLEEWLFFFLIPYACMFIYGALNVLFPRDPFQGSARNLTGVWFVIIAIVAMLNTGLLYTGIKLSLTAVLLLFVYFKKYPWLGKFYRAYLVSLIPFLIVNGILTALPVVWYNDRENLGIRIHTIPVEDTQYTLLLLLMNTILFEHFRKKKTTDGNNQTVPSPAGHDR